MHIDPVSSRTLGNKVIQDRREVEMPVSALQRGHSSKCTDGFSGPEKGSR